MRHFAEKHIDRLGKQVDTIPQQAVDRLQAYSWPGTVRELKNLIERALILTEGTTLQIDATLGTPRRASRQETSSLKLEDVERRHILRVLKQTGWQVAGEAGAATRLGLHPSTLRSRMQKLGIERP